MSVAFSFLTILVTIVFLAVLLGAGIVIAILIEKIFDLDSY